MAGFMSWFWDMVDGWFSFFPSSIDSEQEEKHEAQAEGWNYERPKFRLCLETDDEGFTTKAWAILAREDDTPSLRGNSGFRENGDDHSNHNNLVLPEPNPQQPDRHPPPPPKIQAHLRTLAIRTATLINTFSPGNPAVQVQEEDVQWEEESDDNIGQLLPFTDDTSIGDPIWWALADGRVLGYFGTVHARAVAQLCYACDPGVLEGILDDYFGAIGEKVSAMVGAGHAQRASEAGEPYHQIPLPTGRRGAGVGRCIPGSCAPVSRLERGGEGHGRSGDPSLFGLPRESRPVVGPDADAWRLEDENDLVWELKAKTLLDMM
ncbi:hypothetical protein B0T16DRAFT_392926 [Cercophora newfieldiana]|uniref:Uncharacterized protein n=1 Tax=Cercophora newfieldiana TaxID=92897 RepID=A0AA39Y4B8_9PEZI|nr:hypothetical protein B0T16DRAFT_392926 [Cercophora newfieldiana]